MKNKEGFTLVELLAVIAILAILVIIALPNVINMYNKAQKETFLTEAKKVHSEAEKKYISSSITGNTVKKISSEDDSKLDMTGEKLQYCVILNNKGKVTDMKVSNGKWVASLEDGKAVEDLTIDDLKDGNLDGYECASSQSDDSNAIYCTFDGELTQGAEFVHGQYTYRYMQEGSYSNNGLAWSSIGNDGWGVQLTNKSSTDAVTSEVCTYINNKPVVSMAYMFAYTNASNVDLSKSYTNKVTNMSYMFFSQYIRTLNIDNLITSNVTSMEGMFNAIQIDNLDLSNFNTSKVTNMSNMFFASYVKNLNLSSFDTSNVTAMYYMFLNCYYLETLDLSSFDTSKVTNMSRMFSGMNSINKIYVSNKFVTTNVTSSGDMFDSCRKIVGGSGTVFDSTKTDKTYARIDGGTSNPGYFTQK